MERQTQVLDKAKFVGTNLNEFVRTQDKYIYFLNLHFQQQLC